MIINCTKCSTPFEPSEAAMRKRTWRCKPCRKAYDRANMLKRKARGQSISGARMPREWHRQYGKIYLTRPDVKKRNCARALERLRDPAEAFKARVRQQTRHAVKAGKLQKKPCEVCGEGRSQAHHHDYHQPLNVKWLCPIHHRAVHNSKARGE